MSGCFLNWTNGDAAEFGLPAAAHAPSQLNAFATRFCQAALDERAQCNSFLHFPSGCGTLRPWQILGAVMKMISEWRGTVWRSPVAGFQ
jgi:hypothetical protein